MTQGDADAEMGSAGRRFEDFDAAAVCVDEFGHHGKAYSGAFDVAPLGRLPLVESFENAIALVDRYSGTRIHDIEHQLIALALGMDRNRASARCELDRIRQQVVEDQAYLAAVGERGEILHLHVEAHALRD